MSQTGIKRVLASEHASRIEHIVGITSGTFDLFHSLHLEYLLRCSQQCDTLIVGIDSNRLVRERKGDSRPIMTEGDRAFVVANLKCVDTVFIMDKYEDFWKIVKRSRAQVVFKNHPFRDEHTELDDAIVSIIPDLPEKTSTSSLIKRIRGEQ